MNEEHSRSLTSEEKKKLQLYEQLSVNEAFISWRDEVAKPIIDQLELSLKASDELPESILRGSLKHYFSVKGLFYEVFDQTEAVLAEVRRQEIEEQTEPQ